MPIFPCVGESGTAASIPLLTVTEFPPGAIHHIGGVVAVLCCNFVKFYFSRCDLLK